MLVLCWTNFIRGTEERVASQLCLWHYCGKLKCLCYISPLSTYLHTKWMFMWTNRFNKVYKVEIKRVFNKGFKSVSSEYRLGVVLLLNINFQKQRWWCTELILLYVWLSHSTVNRIFLFLKLECESFESFELLCFIFSNRNWGKKKSNSQKR